MTTQTTPIVDLIPEGHENAIGRRMLIIKCQAAGIIPNTGKDRERLLRQLIHEARTSGNVICNAGDGFFIPTAGDAAFLRHDINRKRKMALEILKPLRQSKALLADIEAGRIK